MRLSLERVHMAAGWKVHKSDQMTEIEADFWAGISRSTGIQCNISVVEDEEHMYTCKKNIYL